MFSFEQKNTRTTPLPRKPGKLLIFKFELTFISIYGTV